MEQEENKVQDPAAAEEAARKREEAIRRVEAMLSQNRVETVQKELDRSNRFRRTRVDYRVKTGEQAYDSKIDLLAYRKPDKPQEEMTPEELEAEQKREAAIQKANLMLIQQRADADLRNSHQSYRTVTLPKRRKPVEENKVDIAGFLSQYKLSPEAQERFAEIRFGGSKKGTVRPALATRLGAVIAPPMLLLVAWVLGQFGNLAPMKPVFIILACLMLFAAYYVCTWKLEYDCEKGIVRYHSLFHGTNLYEMQELMGFMILSHAEKPFPLALLSMLDPREYLVIRLPDHTINIPLLFSRTVVLQTLELDGYEGAGDFCRCLEQYQRDLYSKAASEEKQSAPVTPAQSSIPETPPVPVPEKHVTPEKPKPAAAEKPVTPEQPKPAPLPEPVDLEKAREMFARPAASALSMPERGNDFPDPTKGSAFPDPAQKPKPDVDVDALFNQVLREHGKLK